jgi:hypothetical protein
VDAQGKPRRLMFCQYLNKPSMFKIIICLTLQIIARKGLPILFGGGERGLRHALHLLKMCHFCVWGTQIIALGDQIAAFFTPSDDLEASLSAASKVTGGALHILSHLFAWQSIPLLFALQSMDETTVVKKPGRQKSCPTGTTEKGKWEGSCWY